MGIKHCLRVVFVLVAVVTALPGFAVAQTNDGKASYYSRKFHGKETASGEFFDMFDLTAAHRTLPFNTYVNVTNVSNGLNVVVRINDRGPYINNRVIDLSEAAARQVGAYHHGVIKVRLEVLDIIHLTPALDSIFQFGSVHDCLGNPAQLNGFAISLWSSSELVHTLYVANDLYIKSDLKQVLIGTNRVSGTRRFHVVVTGLKTEQDVKDAITKYTEKGFMEVALYRE